MLGPEFLTKQLVRVLIFIIWASPPVVIFWLFFPKPFEKLFSGIYRLLENLISRIFDLVMRIVEPIIKKVFDVLERILETLIKYPIFWIGLAGFIFYLTYKYYF